MLSRINDAALEPNRMLLTIEGYQNLLVVPLEEALQPVLSFFNRASLEAKLWVVKDRCGNPADNLTPDESAAIMLYTIQWEPREASLYFILNEELRREDRDRLKPWFLFLRLLLNALFKLPPIKETIFRGMGKDLSAHYRLNHHSVWWAFSSCTDMINILESEQFCGRSGVRTIFIIKCFTGRSIKNHSYYETENEILLMPGRYLKIESSYSARDGLRIIQLSEASPPHELLKVPIDNNPWRRQVPGISLLGFCRNTDCIAQQKEVIIPIGFRIFDMLVETDGTTAQCPVCRQYVEVIKLGFYRCQWRLYGINQLSATRAPVPFSKDWSSAPRDSLLEYSWDTSVIWRQMIVEAKTDDAI